MVNKAFAAAAVALAAAASTADAARDLLGRKGTTMNVVQPVTGYQAVQVMQPVQGYQTMRVRVRPGPVTVAQPVVAQPVAVQQVVQAAPVVQQVVQPAEAAPATYVAAPGYAAATPVFAGKHKVRKRERRERESGQARPASHHPHHTFFFQSFPSHALFSLSLSLSLPPTHPTRAAACPAPASR